MGPPRHSLARAPSSLCLPLPVGPSCHQFPLHRTPRADRNCAARKAPVVAESMGPTRPPIKQNPELRNNSSIPYVRRHHNSTYGFEPEITVRAGRGLRTTRRRGNLRPVLLGVAGEVSPFLWVEAVVTWRVILGWGARNPSSELLCRRGTMPLPRLAPPRRHCW